MKLIDYAYEFYLQKRFEKTNRKRHVILSKRSTVDRDCIFEGNNFVDGELHSCELGYGSYVHKNSVLRNVKVGRFSAIGENVNISLFEHPINMVSISPCFYKHNFTLRSFVEEDYFEDFKCGETGYSVQIGNDVWIGQGVSIKSGVVIGDGAVIGTGAVVTKDVPPYAIAVGVPAKVVRYRFSDKQIESLLEMKWWEKSCSWLEENGKYFVDIDEFITHIKTQS